MTVAIGTTLDATAASGDDDVLHRKLATVGQVLADFSESPAHVATLLGVLDQGMDIHMLMAGLESGPSTPTQGAAP